MSTHHAVRHICFVSPHSDPLGRIGDPDTGGQCIYERELARALADLAPDVTVDVYTRWYEPKSRIEQITDRAAVIRIPCGGDQFIRKEDLGPYIPEFVAGVEAYTQEYNRTYDIVHGHYWDGGAAALALVDKWHLPMVFTSHSLGAVKQRDLPDEQTYHYTIRIPFEREAMQRSVRVVALSRVERGYLAEFYGIPAEKVAIIPGGVDTTFFSPRGQARVLRADLKIPGDEDYLVLALGRLDPRKGFPSLMAAAPEVVRRVRAAGKSVRFFVSAGGRDPLSDEECAEQKRIIDAIEAGGVQEAITLVPKLDLTRVPEYYSASDVFAVPSPYEPFGLVIVEAMACGAPVVATDQGGPVDIVSDGQDGYLVNPQNIGLLAERISQILLDDHLRAQMRQNARAKAVQTYSWSAIARQILDCYTTVTEENEAHDAATSPTA